MSQKEWKNGLFGCLDDPKLCVLIYCFPCYAVGKNAEALKEDCLLHGLLCALGLNFAPVIRWRYRQERNIAGTMLMDVLTHTVCPCCTLMQEAREIGWNVPKDFNEVGRSDTSKNEYAAGESFDANQHINRE